MSNKRGRPPLDPDSPSVGLNVKMSGRQFDALCERARASRLELSDYVRRQLKSADTPPHTRPQKT